MLEVLGRATSINVRKVLWTCTEIGLQRDHFEWGTRKLSLASAEFLALNPNGLVPVIRDGDFTLCESNSICRYLASNYERTDLLPASVADRAQVKQWMDWQATELNNAWRYAFMGLVRRSPQHQETTQIESIATAWNRQMGILNAALAAGGPFLLGSAFTLADIVVGLAAHRWYSTPIERTDLPAVAAYYERLSQRPGFTTYGRNGIP